MWAANYGGFLSEMDVFTSEELESDPTYRAFYEPRGIGRSMITAIFPPTGPVLILGVERSYADGPTAPASVQSLNEIRPHLARAALISSRLQAERARAAAEMLGVIGLPALVFSDAGRVMAANDLIQRLPDGIRWLAADRFALIDPGADRMLRRAIEALDRNDPPTPRSFAARGEDAQAAMVAHVVPVRGSARDILVRSTGVLILTPVTRPDAPPVELIQSLFDLTPAEARVARGLAVGDTLDEIAAASGLSRNTIRSQLRGALEKTGSRRQAELVALLGGITPWPKSHA
ncbi:helix-turn-helix transcriptional regulator [Bradyrhizobium liaoningense]|uniref:helix-turn-helix transcriptional regulator n=1 Tax=Bradyrhizobium liaoningense TaxID=43992 RepID=UPI001BA93907|nr:helix-turn-helix transcriptional regulator [Bradyrhizobium liaoningense]